MESRCSSPSSEDVGCVRWRRRGIAMPISISSSSFSIMPPLLVVLCSLPTSIPSRASKQDATLFFGFGSAKNR